MSYGRLAVKFQAALKQGDKFSLIKDYAPHYGKVLIVDCLIREYRNPDDCMYQIKDEDDRPLEPVRSWWLRKCCERVD